MKAFIILAVCLVAVTAKVTIVRRTLLKMSDVSADDEKTFKQCLKDHNIDPEILSESAEEKEDKVNPVSLLSDADLGCFHACLYTAYKYMKPDGTLDFDQLFEGGEKDPEVKWERRISENAQEACRAGAGDNNCRFFQCMGTFKLNKFRISASETE